VKNIQDKDDIMVNNSIEVLTKKQANLLSSVQRYLLSSLLSIA